MNNNKKKWLLILLLVVGLVLTVAVTAIVSINNSDTVNGDSSTNDNGQSNETETDQPNDNAMPSSHIIDNVPVIKQESPLNAGCETYACTMLLQSQGIDMDQFEFANEYLVQKPIYCSGDENWYGPDMDSAYVGEIEWGYGVNSPAMGKFMNQMLTDKGSEKRAQVLSGVELEQLCEDYIVNDIPVMIWATTNMQEPYVMRIWSINYVDEEISDAQIGDTEQWLQNEHCLVLIGYDELNYYFADSVAGDVSVFDKETVKIRYEELDMQAIVVK